MTPAVSVIVPVYKAEATLDACVESILAQTFPDFELLLIDDESPDRCPEMCDAWAKKDPRIRVLHPAKAGPGPSGARNAGVQAAAAPWLTMVDSDDTIAPDLVEKLLAGAETTGAELVICNGCPVTEDGAQHPLPADEQFEGHAAGRRCVLGRLPYAVDQPVHRHGPPPLRRKAF